MLCVLVLVQYSKDVFRAFRARVYELHPGAKDPEIHPSFWNGGSGAALCDKSRLHVGFSSDTRRTHMRSNGLRKCRCLNLGPVFPNPYRGKAGDVFSYKFTPWGACSSFGCMMWFELFSKKPCRTLTDLILP